MDFIYEKQFKKDTDVCKARGYDMELLKQAIVILHRKGILPANYKTHTLKGTKYLNKNIKDSHLDNDWIILYRIKANKVYLIRIGTHADLFG
jgi:mRNA interferase YafQ